MEPSRIPNRLKYHRTIVGFSQKKVAGLLGLRDTSMLSRWERGAAYPSLIQAFRLATIYQTVPHALYPLCWEETKSHFEGSEIHTPILTPT